MPLNPNQRQPIMCLTLDGHALSHLDQVRALAAAGAKLIQLRMKHVTEREWIATASACAAICRVNAITLIVNDSVDVAVAAGAAGVHLGKSDEAWNLARRRMGPRALIGGTVNNAEDARRAVESGALDYVGVGPYRFTTTKAKLAPVLGLEGIAALLPLLGPLPAWAIGGIEPGDLPGLREAGLAGVAVSSGLFCGDAAANFQQLTAAWTARAHSLISK
jgi:thiamine-phosphate pyrophosphorylase